VVLVHGSGTDIGRSFPLLAPAADDRNVWLQDGCPGNTADHSGMLEDSRAAAAVLSALAGDQRALPC
jgi:hypothetical protein